MTLTLSNIAHFTAPNAPKPHPSVASHSNVCRVLQMAAITQLCGVCVCVCKSPRLACLYSNKTKLPASN